MLTSEAHTLDASVPPQVAIGEIVRYRLVVRLPEGTATNFQMQDLLPAGMGFLDDGTSRMAFVTNGTGITSAAFGSVPGIAGACTVNGNAADGTTPTAPLPCSFGDFNIGSNNSTAGRPGCLRRRRRSVLQAGDADQRRFRTPTTSSSSLSSMPWCATLPPTAPARC